MLTTRARMPSAASSLAGLERESHLGAGGEQDHVRVAAGGVGEHVGALRDARRRRVADAVERGQGLPGEDERRGLVAEAA